NEHECRSETRRVLFFGGMTVPSGCHLILNGMKARMVDAGTKYLAISFSWLSASPLFGRRKNLRLMMPSRHLFPASNTPDPEFSVAPTSLINVENFLGTRKGSDSGDMIYERAVSSGTATMTCSPGCGFFSHRGMRRICR